MINRFSSKERSKKYNLASVVEAVDLEGHQHLLGIWISPYEVELVFINARFINFTSCCLSQVSGRMKTDLVPVAK